MKDLSSTLDILELFDLPEFLFLLLTTGYIYFEPLALLIREFVDPL